MIVRTASLPPLTPQQQQIVDLVLTVPADQWVSFGDVADAMRVLGYGCTARNVSNALHKYTDRYRTHQVTEDEWRRLNIWGKVRNSRGFVVWAGQGTGNPRGARVVHDVRNPSNVAWVDAGGRLDADASAKLSCRYPLASIVGAESGRTVAFRPAVQRTQRRSRRPQAPASVVRCAICCDVLIDGECAHGCSAPRGGVGCSTTTRSSA